MIAICTMKTSNENAAGAPAPCNTCATDGTAHFTPAQLAGRWGWHVESVRRAIRQRRFESIVISRRRLIPIAEVERIEAEGRLARA
jgi:hypothetical protein